MSLHHILVICFYTDFTDLCREYRSSYRRIATDKNNDDIRYRHSKFYFFSRFLFESVEFFGDIMERTDVVYHGLDQELVFANFLTHFNAPMSTTWDRQSASNFAGEEGIILDLKNGNTNIKDNYIISQFESDQPRYIDVNWISAHDQERMVIFWKIYNF